MNFKVETVLNEIKNIQDQVDNRQKLNQIGTKMYFRLSS
jgi:hypothetical protein